MKYSVSHDSLGTHVDWRHDGVTARMVDWFWSNLEKGFVLWNPERHEELVWVKAPNPGGLLGAVYLAPQVGGDGRWQNMHLRFEDLSDLTVETRDAIGMEHAIVIATLGQEAKCLNEPHPLGYRIHQWQKTDEGVVGRSSSIGALKKESVADGKIWAAHCVEVVGNWADFLPQLYDMYKVVNDPARNPCADLSLEGRGREARYRHSSKPLGGSTSGV